jgi:hypothetical protein
MKSLLSKRLLIISVGNFRQMAVFYFPGTEKSAHLLCFLEGFSSKEKQPIIREEGRSVIWIGCIVLCWALNYEFLRASVGEFLQKKIRLSFSVMIR